MNSILLSPLRAARKPLIALVLVGQLAACATLGGAAVGAGIGALAGDTGTGMAAGAAAGAVVDIFGRR